MISTGDVLGGLKLVDTSDLKYVSLFFLKYFFLQIVNLLVFPWSLQPTPLLVAFVAIQSFDVDITQLFFILSLLAPRCPSTG